MVSLIPGGLLVGFSWILWLAGFRWNSGWSREFLVGFLSWFWAVFGGILGGLVDFWWISRRFLVGFVVLGGFRWNSGW